MITWRVAPKSTGLPAWPQSCLLHTWLLNFACLSSTTGAAKIMGVGSSGGLWRISPDPAPCNGACGSGTGGLADSLRGRHAAGGSDEGRGGAAAEAPGKQACRGGGRAATRSLSAWVYAHAMWSQ